MPDQPTAAVQTIPDLRPGGCFAAVSYDPAARTLFMRFDKGSTTYTWDGVPAAVFAGLEAAGSRGRYYHDHIRGKYATDYSGGGP